jgi:hypothetical protein
MKIKEPNCWVVLDTESGETVSWSTWRYVDSSNSCWPYDQNCRLNTCAGSFHHVRFHGAVAVVTKISFCCWWVHVSQHVNCPSKLMRSNLHWSCPLRHPFSVSVVLVQRHGACLFCWAVLPRMNLFYVCPSHQKVLRDKKKLSINILS